MPDQVRYLENDHKHLDSDGEKIIKHFNTNQQKNSIGKTIVAQKIS